jgi:hypothetical protein
MDRCANLGGGGAQFARDLHAWGECPRPSESETHALRLGCF